MFSNTPEAMSQDNPIQSLDEFQTPCSLSLLISLEAGLDGYEKCHQGV
jgi:hypothetical protein